MYSTGSNATNYTPCTAVSTAGDSSIYVAGSFTKTFHFDASSQSAPGELSLFLVRLDVEGNLQKLLTASSGGSGVKPFALGAHASGMVVIGGYCIGSGQFGNVAVSPVQAFLAGANFDLVSTTIPQSFDSKVLRISPNPASDEASLTLPQKSDCLGCLVSIRDLTGKLVVEQPFSSTLNITKLKPGVYILSINNGSKIWSNKFIKGNL